MKSAVAMTPKMLTSASATCSTAFCAANAGAAATTGTAAAALRTVCATFGALNAAYNTNQYDTKTVSQSPLHSFIPTFHHPSPTRPHPPLHGWGHILSPDPSPEPTPRSRAIDRSDPIPRGRRARTTVVSRDDARVRSTSSPSSSSRLVSLLSLVSRLVSLLNPAVHHAPMTRPGPFASIRPYLEG